MMKVISELVSMNPVMIDGFACVFDEAMRRQAMYKKEESLALEKHNCKLGVEKNA